MKIKTKTVKANTPSGLSRKLDEVAEAYASGAKEEKEAAKKKAEANDTIKTMAKSFGADQGKDRLVSGHKWEAGYSIIEQPYIDQKLARKILGKARYAKVTETVVTVSPNKFKALVDAGEITQDEARKIVRYAEPQKRIVVRPKKGSPTP